MAEDVEFTGSVPELYDRLMVPMIFTEPAVSLARRVASRAAVQIPETAAGTGVLTEAMLEACPDAEVLATDLNQPMLDGAAMRAREQRPGSPRAGRRPRPPGGRRVVRPRRLPVRGRVLP